MLTETTNKEKLKNAMYVALLQRSEEMINETMKSGDMGTLDKLAEVVRIVNETRKFLNEFVAKGESIEPII
jgi:hypothetical protein